MSAVIRVALCALLALTGCATASPPPPPGAPTLSPADFLAQVICPDGVLQLAEPTCPNARPMRSTDPIVMAIMPFANLRTDLRF